MSVRAADLPLSVFLDGTRVDKRNAPSGFERAGKAYIDAAKAVQMFDGLLSIGDAGVVKVSIEHRTLTLYLGSKVAFLNGYRVPPLKDPPIRVGGEVYLPASALAEFTSKCVAVDPRRNLMSFKDGDCAVFPTNPNEDPVSDDDDPPLPPTQALTIVTSATIDGRGLHVRAAVHNLLTTTYVLPFPSGRQIAFILNRDGNEVWNSEQGVTDDAPSQFSIGPLETKLVTADDPAFDKLGAGRYTLRVRLMTPIPIDFTPVSLGIETPVPTATR